MAFINVTRDQNGTVQKIDMLRPSDFHTHLRQGALCNAIAAEISWPYKYVLVMPNTKPPIVTPKQARTYKLELEEILHKVGITHCTIIPTIYLCMATTPHTINAFAEAELMPVVKSYPPGGTTNSDDAVPLLSKKEVLAELARVNGRLLVHGECVTDSNGMAIRHEAREDYYMRNVFPQLRTEHPDLLICQEHITTSIGVESVTSDKSGKTVCTITPQHMLLNNSAFKEPWGGVHARCMPYLKEEADRSAIAEFATSGDSRAILGTDCAAHLRRSKETAFEQAMCGCYTPHALAMYAKVFENMKRLDYRFVQFTSLNGPRWWNQSVPKARERITFINDSLHSIPSPTAVPEENDVVVPLGWTEDFTQRMALEFALEHPH